MSNEFYLDPGTAEKYDRTFPGLEGDVDFYRTLALEVATAGQEVLELACGTGRVTIPIALAGVKVTGLDSSAAMLALARKKSEGIENIAWVEGNMAAFDLRRTFGLVIIPYRSFLHLETVEDQKSCLAAIRRHLVPGGRLALNFWNPDIRMMGLRLAGAGGLRPLVPAAEDDRSRFWSLAEYRTASQTIDEVRLREELDSQGLVVSRVYRNMRLRYVFRYEMEHLLALSGFEVEALQGGFKGEPFTDASTEMVWLARKT